MGHTYWRIQSTVRTQDNYLSISNCTMEASLGSGNLAVGGSASASSNYNVSSDPSYAFLGNTTLWWTTAFGQDTAYAWLQYQFPSPVDIGSLTFYPRTDGYANDQGIKQFELQYSDDGTTFTTHGNWIASTWTQDVPQTFTYTLSDAVTSGAFIEALTKILILAL